MPETTMPGSDASNSPLFSAEERLQILEANLMDTALYFVNSDGHITQWSAGAERLLGYTALEVLTKHEAALALPEERQVEALRQERELASLNGRNESEHWYVRKDGSRLWGHSILTAIRNPKGLIRGYARIVVNITERRIKDRALRETLAVLDTLLETAPIGFALLDRDLRYIRVNAALETINGVSAESHVGKTTEEVLPGIAKQMTGDLKQVLETGQPVLNREVNGFTPASPQEIRHWLVSYYPVRISEGQLLGIGAVVVELTDQKRAEAHIQALNERLQRSMTETHHRVKNNLQIISAMIDLQVMENRASVPIEEFSRLNAHVRSLAAVHEVLTEEAKRDQQAQFLSAGAVLNRLLPMVQQTMDSRRLRYRIEDARVPAHQGTSLALITDELILNALKYGRGDIEVAFTVEGQTATLQVLDDGKGFPEGFDPLTAANTGLDLVRNLVAWELKGTLRYENREGGGARVVVTIPLNGLVNGETASDLPPAST